MSKKMDTGQRNYVIIATRVSPSVKALIWKIAEQERRKPADWLRIVIEDAVAARNGK